MQRSSIFRKKRKRCCRRKLGRKVACVFENIFCNRFAKAVPSANVTRRDRAAHCKNACVFESRFLKLAHFAHSGGGSQHALCWGHAPSSGEESSHFPSNPGVGWNAFEGKRQGVKLPQHHLAASQCTTQFTLVKPMCVSLTEIYSA